MTALLKHPGIAVGIAEVGEGGVIRPVRIQTSNVRALPPATTGVLVPDLADVDPSIRQLASARLDIGTTR